MTYEDFEKARELYDDMKYLKKCVKEHEEERHWISVMTPDHRDGINIVTQKKIVFALKNIINEMEREFESL